MLVLMMLGSGSIAVATGVFYNSLTKGIACGLASFICGLVSHIWLLRSARRWGGQDMRNPLNYNEMAGMGFYVGAGIGGGIAFVISYFV